MIYILCTITACLLSIWLGWTLYSIKLKRGLDRYFKTYHIFKLTADNYKDIIRDLI